MSNLPSPLNPGMTRRKFLYSSALVVTASALPAFARSSPRKISPNDKLNIAVIGCGGKGSSDLHWCSGENIVALCDVAESDAVAKARQSFPNAKFYKDFRE